MSLVSKRILAFFSIFNRALKKEEIEEYVGKEVFLSKKDFNEKSGFWTVSKNGANFSINLKNIEISKKFLKKAKKYLPFLRFLPFIRAVAVVNSVSFGSADEKSDIDLFIITKNKHIWTARIFTTFFLHILGVRRHGKKISGRFCLSFFADENNLDLS